MSKTVQPSKLTEWKGLDRISVKAYPAEGKNHTTINNDLGLSGDRPTQEMWEFLSVALKK